MASEPTAAGRETPVIPDDVKSRLASLSSEIERLEQRELQLAQEAVDLVRPYLGTTEGCEAAIDLLPCGYPAFYVRRMQASLEAEDPNGAT